MDDPYDRITIGQTVTERRICRAEDLVIHGHATGLRPLATPSPKAPAMWLGGVVEALVCNQMPGPGSVITHMDMAFEAEITPGTAVNITLCVTGKTTERGVAVHLSVTSEAGAHIARGALTVRAPSRDLGLGAQPDVFIHTHRHFQAMLTAARAHPPLPTAVVCPETADTLGAALDAAREGLIVPTLIGRRAAIEAAHDGVAPLPEIIEAATPEDAAAKAVALIRAGKAAAIQKGHLHTDTLLRPIVARAEGLRGARRLSHVFVMDVPGLDHPLLISDAAINIAPDLAAKADIVQNAIHVAHAIGIETPKVGILSAVETVTPAIPSTIDAADLSRMAARGEITGGIVDGPLALDGAVDLNAARTKGITSLVAGRADILIAPNLEAGNMLAKELTFLAHAEAGGIVMGATCPIILTSRADSAATRLASCAVAVLVAAKGPFP